MSHYQPYHGKDALSTFDSSHDTLDLTKNKNWLVNQTGVGAYVHGRVHQQVDNLIYVGDMVHKRGHLMTEDILLMEEQELLSMGEPLSVPSRLGVLMCMAVLPTMNTANGEGDLIAYYQNGVVAFDTHEAPRESRYDGDGVQLQKGWDSKRLVNHLLNIVSAVGRYAVAILPRDHLFRSVRGLHFLKVVLGEGSFDSENTNTISQDVSPLLEKDTLLDGSATGFWIWGNRMFTTTGLINGGCFSTSSMGRGMVAWNQATTFTEDRTPRSAWEGLWIVDNGIAGIHKFTETALTAAKNTYGFVCSARDGRLLVGKLDSALTHDIREGAAIPIEWSFDTGKFAPEGLTKFKEATDLVIDGTYSTASQKIRVWIRTDLATWAVWRTFSPCDKVREPGQSIILSESLGKPPVDSRTFSWCQIRIEGIGFVEIHAIDLDFSSDIVKAGRHSCIIVDNATPDYFAINDLPTNERWT